MMKELDVFAEALGDPSRPFLASFVIFYFYFLFFILFYYLF